jgi:hypothetical protein
MERLQWCFSEPRRKLSRQLASLSLCPPDVSCLETPPLFRRFKSPYKIYFEISPSAPLSTLVEVRLAVFESRGKPKPPQPASAPCLALDGVFGNG